MTTENEQLNKKRILRGHIANLVGAASMCWNPIPLGEFDSAMALELVDKYESLFINTCQPAPLQALDEGKIQKIIYSAYFPDRGGVEASAKAAKEICASFAAPAADEKKLEKLINSKFKSSNDESDNLRWSSRSLAKAIAQAYEQGELS